MTWRAEDPQGHEQRKCRWRSIAHTQGDGLDLGCGPEKLIQSKHCIGVDSCKDTGLFGIPMKPDVEIDVTDLSMFSPGKFNYVFSSHTLEHIPYDKVPEVLREWWRVVKTGGKMILYLPDEGQYPKIGEPGANPDHKWNVSKDAMLDAMRRSGVGWDLVEFEVCSGGQEYSLWFVFKKDKNPHAQKESWKEGTPYAGNTGASLYHKNPESKKTVIVVRYGAYGDVAQAASVIRGLKKQGYHVTFLTTYPASELVAFDSNIDRLQVQMQDQIPSDWLGHYWVWLKTRYDKFVNLTQSCEGVLLATEGSVLFSEWSPAARHDLMNLNYLETQHKIARVPYEPWFEFFPTDDEKRWAKKQADKLAANGVRNVIMWGLAGSARTHKTWPYIDQIFLPLLKAYRNWCIVTVGDGACAELEEGFDGEPRVLRTSGKWNMRQVCTFLTQHTDIVVGPETGLMSVAAFYEKIAKLVFLSHSTRHNLCRDWPNTTSLYAPDTVCPGRGMNEAPACHMMLPTWNGCRRNDVTGVAQCSSEIRPEWVWNELQRIMLSAKTDPNWTPPVGMVYKDSPIMARPPISGPGLTQGNAEIVKGIQDQGSHSL